MVQLPPTTTPESLSRLAAKPGVKSTLILSKSDGSIIKSTGFLASPATQDPSAPALAGNGFNHSSPLSDDNVDRGTSKSAEHVASMVFKFVAVANELAVGLEEGDDARLLRMRTKKSEIVIALDPKFLSVVIHDAPPA
ncbi:MAG: hypothetical protein Q9218_001383 [Villophora microphyllina]